MSRLIFLDTANLDEIKLWIKRGICGGITTNQKILLKEKNITLKRRILEICRLTKTPVSVELTGHDSVEKMVKEAREYSRWKKNIVVKVPMTTDGMGLEVINKIKKINIKTNATLMVSFEQLILAIISGATYVSIFFNRAKDAGYDQMEIIRRARNFIDQGGYRSQIIAGSIRQKTDIGDAFAAGADIVTVPPPLLESMLAEEVTQKTVIEFDAAWEEFKKQ